jgi:hypothetical protein
VILVCFLRGESPDMDPSPFDDLKDPLQNRWLFTVLMVMTFTIMAL